MAGRLAMQVLAILLVGALSTTEGARFTWRTVLQENCFAGEQNTIYVALQSDTVLDRDTAISIRGLQGAIVDSPDAVVLSGVDSGKFSNGGCGTGTEGRAIFRTLNDAGEEIHALILWPAEQINASETIYFSFTVTNPEQEQMPRVTIEASGGVGIPRVDVWTQTQLTEHLDLGENTCMVGAATPSAEIVNHNGLNADAILVLRAHLPETIVFHVEDCSDTQTRSLYASGIQRVRISEVGCGCTADSGTIVALENGVADQKFSATFDIDFACVDAVGAVQETFDTMEICRKECEVLMTAGGRYDWVCISTVSEDDIEIINPGWGYDEAPELIMEADVEAVGCEVSFTAELAEGSGFEATYEIVRYFCDDGCTYLPDECPSGDCASCTGEAVATVTNRGSGYLTTETVTLSRAVTPDRPGDCPLQDPTELVIATQLADRHLVGGATDPNDIFDCEPVSGLGEFARCYHTPPEVTMTNVGDCEDVFTVTTQTPRLPDYCGSEYGDAYPMKIRGYDFMVKRIRQSTSNPGARNTITVSLVSAFRLMAGSEVHLRGFVNAGLDRGAVELTFDGANPGYSTDAEWVCPSTLKLTVLTDVDPGDCANFTFLAHNNKPEQVQLAEQVELLVANNSDRNTPDWIPMDMGDEGDSSGLSEPFHVLPAAFTHARVYQLYAYPRFPSQEYSTSDNSLRIGDLEDDEPRQNVLYLEFETNFDIELTTFIEISGLTGVTMETSLRSFEPTGAGHEDLFSSLFCSRAHASQNAASCLNEGRYEWDSDSKTMLFYPRQRIEAGTRVMLQASVEMTEFDDPEIYIRTVQHRTSLTTDTVIFAGIEVEKTLMELGLDDDAACPSKMWNQKMEETIPFSVREADFLIKTIHQTNPFLGESNTIHITLAVNVPLFPDSTITIEPLHSEVKWVNSGFNPVEGDSHSDEFILTIEPDQDTQLKAQIRQNLPMEKVMLPGRCYNLTVTSIDNPAAEDFVSGWDTRTASQVRLSLDVPSIPSLLMDKSDYGFDTRCTDKEDYHPFRYRNPGLFCYTYMVQTSSTPNAHNKVTVSFATNFAYSDAVLLLSNWPEGLLASPVNANRNFTQEEGQIKFGPFALTAGEVQSYTFTLTNGASTPDENQFFLALRNGGARMIAATSVDLPPESVCSPDIRPLRVLEAGICACTITSDSVVLPDQDNTLTVSFRSTVDIPSAEIDSSTVFTLKQTQGDAWTSRGVGIPINPSVSYLSYDAVERELRFNNATANVSVSDELSFKFLVRVPLPDTAEQPQFTLAVNGDEALACGSSLQVLSPSFTLAKVGQLNPYPNANNAIVVTLQANYKPQNTWYIELKLSNIQAADRIIIDTDGNPNTRGVVEISLPTTDCFGPPGPCPNFNTGNLSVFSDPEPEVGESSASAAMKGRLVQNPNNPTASIWFQVTDAFEVETPYIFSFAVRNPSKARSSVDVHATAWPEYLVNEDDDNIIPSTEVLQERGLPSFLDTCSDIFMPVLADTAPLFVRQPAVVQSTICQSSQFPSTENTISVSLVLNTAIPAGTYVTLSGFSGLFRSGQDSEAQIREVTGDVSDTDIERSDVNNALQVRFRVKTDFNLNNVQGDDARGIEFAFKTDNPPSAQPGANVEVSMEDDVNADDRQIELIGAVSMTPCSAGPVLFIQQGNFTRSVINQKIPYPGAINTLYVTIESNVPMVENTQFLITGLTADDLVDVSSSARRPTGLDFARLEGDSLSATLVQALCVTEIVSTGIVVKGVNQETNEELATVTGIRRPCQNTNFVCELQMRFGISQENPEFVPLRFGIRVRNPTVPQDAPPIFVSTTEGTNLGIAQMFPDRTICDDCTKAENSDALRIVVAEFRSATITQTNPWPLGENYFILTFDASVALEPGTIITVSGLPTSSDFTQAVQMSEYTSGSVAAIRIDELEQIAGAAGDQCLDGDISDANHSAFDAKYPANCGRVENDIIISDPGTEFTVDNPLYPIFNRCGTNPVGVQNNVIYTRDVFDVSRDVNNGELHLTVKDDTRTTRCSPLYLKFLVNNPGNLQEGWTLSEPLNIVATTSDGATVALERAIDVDPTDLGPTNSQDHFEICGRDTACPENRTLDVVVGDARPFTLYPPRFEYWTMEQTSPYPDACNLITATFKSNLNIPVGATVSLTFNMADDDALMHPLAPSLGGFVDDDDVNTRTAPRLALNKNCTSLGLGIYECELDKVFPYTLRKGDYVRSYSGLEREALFVPISTVFKVVAIDGRTLRLVIDDHVAPQDIELPRQNNYFAKVVYIRPMPGDQGDEVFERGGHLSNPLATSWAGAKLELTVKRTILSGREYSFGFMVRNAIPPSHTAGVDSIVVNASWSNNPVTWNPTDATLFRTGVIVQTEANMSNSLGSDMANTVEDTVIDVTGPMDLKYYGPGIYLLIDDEIVMVVYHGDTVLWVRRAQLGTAAAAHLEDALVRPVLPGSMNGDRVPLAVHARQMALRFGRQTNPLPGKFNRHQYTLAANFPLTKMHLLNIDPLLGATPAFGVLEPPCLRTDDLDDLRRCTALEPPRQDFFRDVKMTVSDDLTMASFNDMKMILDLSAQSERLRINTFDLQQHNHTFCDVNGSLLLDRNGNCTFGNNTYNYTYVTNYSDIYPDWPASSTMFPVFASNETHCWPVDYNGTRPEPDFFAYDYVQIGEEQIYVVENCALLRGQLGTEPLNHSHQSRMFSIMEEGAPVFFGSCPANTPSRNIIPAGHLFQFTYSVLNPASHDQDRQEAAVTMLNLTFAPEATANIQLSNISYDEITPPLGEDGEYGQAGDLALMEVYGKTFIFTQVGQSNPNPGHEDNQVCVTLRPSFTVPGDSIERTTFTLSGFANAIHDDGDIDISWSDSISGAVLSTGTWSQATSSLEFELPADAQAGYLYEMCFHLTNPPDSQAGQTITLNATGEVESVSIKHRDISTCSCPEGWHLLRGEGGGGSGFSAYVFFHPAPNEDRTPLLAFVDQGPAHPVGRPAPTRGMHFTGTPDVHFDVCSPVAVDNGATPDDAVNPCGCSCQASEMFAANVHGIKSLINVEVVCDRQVEWDEQNDMVVVEGGMGSGFSAKFEAPNSVNGTGQLIIQHHGDHYLYTPYAENVSTSGCTCDAFGVGTSPAGGTCGCNGPELKLVGDYATWCNLTTRNPTIEVTGSMIIPTHVLQNAAGEMAPLLVNEPVWLQKRIGQGSPWPGAYNEMTITLQSNAAFQARSVITISGFGSATEDKATDVPRRVYDEYPASTVFRSEVSETLETVYTWNEGAITFAVKRRWQDETPLVLHFRVNNPDLIANDQYPEIDYSFTPKITISEPDDADAAYIAEQDMTASDEDQGGIEEAARPLRIYTNTWDRCAPENQNRPIEFWDFLEPCHYPDVHDHAGIVHEAHEICTDPTESGIVPVIGMTSVGQSECRPNMVNTITVTLVSNVPLGWQCAAPCLDAAAITIIGIKGGNIDVLDPDATQLEVALGQPEDADDSYSAGPDSIFGQRAKLPSDDEVLDDTNADGDVEAIQVEVQAGEVVIPGRLHVFSFDVINGPDEQFVEDVPPFIMRVNANGQLRGYSPLHDNDDDYGAVCYGAGECKNVRLSPALYMHMDMSKESRHPLRIHGISELSDFEIVFKDAANPSQLPLVAGTGVIIEISFSMNEWVRMPEGRTLEITLDRFESSGALSVSDNLGAFQTASFNADTDILTLTVGNVDPVPNGKDGPDTFTAITVEGLMLPREGNIANNPRMNFKSDPDDCLDGWIPATPDPVERLTVTTSGPPVGWLERTTLDWSTLVEAGEPNAGENNRIAGKAASITATFRLWMDVSPDDKIVFTLPGFTGADATGTAQGAGPRAAEWNFEWTESTTELSLSPVELIDMDDNDQLTVEREFTVTVPQSANIVVPAEGVPTVQDPPFQVRADVVSGPVRTLDVDAHEPVYVYRCKKGTVTASNTNQGYCNGDWAIQMCAMNTAEGVDALAAYIATNSLESAGGYVAAAVSEEGTSSGTPLSSCGAAIDTSCKAISADLQSVTFLDYAGDLQKQNLCCKHSHEAATVGLGNLATCLDDDDCINIEAGRTSLDPEGTGVAVFETEFVMCCDWCYEYYGVVACGEADYSPKGADDPAVRAFCENPRTPAEGQTAGLGCRTEPPCYGHHLEATANPPQPPSGDDDTLEVVTLKGDGVTISQGDVDGDQKAPISVFELSEDQLSVAARDFPGQGILKAGSILEFGPPGLVFNNPVPIEIQIDDSLGGRDLGNPPRTTIPASGAECCDCDLAGCNPDDSSNNCVQAGAETNPNCPPFDCNDYCQGGSAAAVEGGGAGGGGAQATTAAGGQATTTPSPARRLLNFAGSGDLRHLLQEDAPAKGDGDDYIIYKLVGETWKAVAPTQIKSVRNEALQQVWKAKTLISGFSTYAPFFGKYPEVAPISKYWTTAGDEVYLTVAAAVFLVLLAWLIIILPCFRREKPLPPLPPPPPPPPPPVPFLPPPPAAAPVFVTDVPPHTRYNTQGAPIKHFGPDMPGHYEAGLEDGQVEDEFLHGAGPEPNPNGMLGYPHRGPGEHSFMEESYMPPVPMYGPPLSVMGMSAAPQTYSAAPQAFSAAPQAFSAAPLGHPGVPQYSAAPQYPGGYPGEPFL